MIVFGGYDGQQRLNDLHAFHFTSCKWHLLSSVDAPAARDRHSAAVYQEKFVVFGGFDGLARVDDLHTYCLTSNRWTQIIPAVGSAPPPSARHSHSAVQWKDSLFIFGGYDGAYKSDLHEYNFITSKWSQVARIK